MSRVRIGRDARLRTNFAVAAVRSLPVRSKLDNDSLSPRSYDLASLK
jgi:hypothetical protein